MHDRALLLENPVQHYAWGSRTAIAELLGRAVPAPRPEAEMWMGAHPKAPSRIVDPPGLGRLDEALLRDPVRLLGREVCDRFGPELPFLFKVLAAAEPLSIQVHPGQQQAREGCQRENEAGIPIDAPHRNYKDPNHKPELVCALTSFVALHGFRPPAEIVRHLGSLGIPQVANVLDRLARGEGSLALRALLAGLLTLDAEESAPVLRRAAAVTRRPGDQAWEWVGRLLEKHPGDMGALAPLYLNLVVLEPGQALYLDAGELHAYLHGTALELMANSDNVLRGGLTPKHVDVPELLDCLTFEPRPAGVVSPTRPQAGESVYATPAREFELALIDVEPSRPFQAAARRGIEILLGLEGAVSLECSSDSRPLARGTCLAIPAALPAYRLDGRGRIARARVPLL